MSQKSVFWEIVPGEQCNLECRSCYAANGGRPDTRLLREAEALDVVRKLVDLGVEKIDLLGGEPLSYRFLDSVISEFKRCNQRSFFGVVTNGTLITHERALQLKLAGVDQVSISLDGITPETNDWNRGEGSFHRILQGIEHAVAAGLGLTISFTITRRNVSETPEFIPFAEKVGATSIGVQITENTGRAQLNWEEIGIRREDGLEAITRMFYRKPKIFVGVSSRLRFKEFLNYFYNAALPIEDERCGGGKEEFMITSGGDFVPCSLYAYGENKGVNKGQVNLVQDEIGNVSTMMERQYQRFNTEMRTEAVRKFATCQDCQYHLVLCDPCPLGNPAGEVPECEWVKQQTQINEQLILDSEVELKIVPERSGSRSLFFVPTQASPVEVAMTPERFNQTFGSGMSGKEILHLYADDSKAPPDAARRTLIEFLAKLRSHEIMSLSYFPGRQPVSMSRKKEIEGIYPLRFIS